jgi:hypothetical protein
LSLDLTGCATLSDNFLLNFQGNFGTEPHAGFKGPTSAGMDSSASWYGLGVQPVYTSGDFSFGGRLEWFADPNGARVYYGGAAGPLPYFAKGSYVNITAAPGYKLSDGFRIRAELRADISTNKDIALVARGNGKVMVSGGVMADYQF